ncbi:9812_t:CDS:2, partial [Scutellospora calospora]
VDDIISKVKRLLNEESFKNSAKRLQFLAKVNSKRKHRAADLIEIVMNTVRYEGVRDENGEFRVDNANLLRDWIIPDMRIGYDVYGVAIALCGGFAPRLQRQYKDLYWYRLHNCKGSERPKILIRKFESRKKQAAIEGQGPYVQ